MRLLGESKAAFNRGDEGAAANLFTRAAALNPGLYFIEDFDADEPKISRGEGTIEDLSKYLRSEQFTKV